MMRCIDSTIYISVLLACSGREFGSCCNLLFHEFMIKQIVNKISKADS
jgi:hypothetical protein